MATVAHAPGSTPPYTPRAFYAHLDTTEGIALRMNDGTVHFQTTATGQWQQLCNADAPRLLLHHVVEQVAG